LASFLLVNACGGGNSKQPAGPNGTGGGDSGVCANVACIQTAFDLTTAGTAGGSCVHQTIASPLSETRCYDNGIHYLMTTETSSDATTSTVTITISLKKNGTPLLTKTAVDVFPAGAEAGTSPLSTNLTTMDGSGALVAAVHVEGGVTTITCPGSPPTALPDSCGFSALMVSGTFFTDPSASNCSAGTCSF
jgi:hypothetical protein